MPFLSQNIDSIVDFLWDIDNFIFFALVFPGNFHSIDLRFDSRMNNESGVSSIVMIFERNNSPIWSKMDKLFWHHFKRWACISAVKSFGTKREQSFLISNEDKKVCTVPLLVFNPLVFIILSSFTILFKFFVTLSLISWFHFIKIRSSFCLKIIKPSFYCCQRRTVSSKNFV